MSASVAAKSTSSSPGKPTMTSVESAYLIEQQRAGEAPLAAADVGHDAEGAEAVAAAHHGHPRPHAAGARYGEVGVGLFGVEPQGDVWVTVPGSEQLGQAAVGVGP